MIFLLFSITVFQDDWSGGADSTPVLQFKNNFYSSEHISFQNPGYISLTAQTYDYNAWEKHSIEYSTSIWGTSTVFPVDFDHDGDVDFIGIRKERNEIVYYENIGMNFVPNVIASVSNPITLWPEDIDVDGDSDIVVATGGESANPGEIYWLENNGNLSFTPHLIIHTSYRWWFTVPGDMDNDGDIDIVATDVTNSDGRSCGNVWLFENNGSMKFTPLELWHGVNNQERARRIFIADLNNDGWNDIVTSYYPLMVFINRHDKTFTQKTIQSGYVDGAWVEDFNNDGFLDIFAANSTIIRWYENTSDGLNYIAHTVKAVSRDYEDGAVAGDIDLDGLTDVACGYNNIAWFKQKTDGTFDTYEITQAENNHWLYLFNAHEEDCDVDIDILGVRENEIFYLENKIVSSFYNDGNLLSSILDTKAPSIMDSVMWDVCTPQGYRIEIYLKASSDTNTLENAEWIGPLTQGAINDTFFKTPYRYYQYKIHLRRLSAVAAPSSPLFDFISFTYHSQSPMISFTPDTSVYLHPEERINVLSILTNLSEFNDSISISSMLKGMDNITITPSLPYTATLTPHDTAHFTTAIVVRNEAKENSSDTIELIAKSLTDTTIRDTSTIIANILFSGKLSMPDTLVFDSYYINDSAYLPLNFSYTLNGSDSIFFRFIKGNETLYNVRNEPLEKINSMFFYTYTDVSQQDSLYIKYTFKHNDTLIIEGKGRKLLPDTTVIILAPQAKAFSNIAIEPDTSGTVMPEMSISYTLRLINLSDQYAYPSVWFINESAEWAREIQGLKNTNNTFYPNDSIAPYDTVYFTLILTPPDSLGTNITGIGGNNVLTHIDTIVASYQNNDTCKIVTDVIPVFNVHNYPNPFTKNGTTFFISLPMEGDITLSVYTRAGEKVKELLKTEHLDRGIHHIFWDGKNEKGKNTASGIFVYVCTYKPQDGKVIKVIKKAVKQ